MSAASFPANARLQPERPMEPTVVIVPLFDEEPSRPVADRLRPTKLEDVVGHADAAVGPA